MKKRIIRGNTVGTNYNPEKVKWNGTWEGNSVDIKAKHINMGHSDSVTGDYSASIGDYRSNINGSHSFSAAYKGTITDKGNYSWIGGNGCTVDATCCFSHGYRTQALADRSVTFGTYTYSTKENQLVCGAYNDKDDNATFIAGVGDGTRTRRNCFSTGEKANKESYIKVGNTELTESQLISLLSIGIPTAISFTLEGKVCYALEGMNWVTWVGTAYNVDGYKIVNNTLCDKNGIRIVLSSDLLTGQNGTDVIAKGVSYEAE